MKSIASLIESYLFIFYLLADVSSLLLAEVYIQRRLKRQTYKLYSINPSHILFMLGVILMQAVCSATKINTYTADIVLLGISCFYIFVAYTDARIRIIGNDVILLFILGITAFHLINSSLSILLYYLSFSFIVFCLLNCTELIICKTTHSSQGIGMGDIKLLCATAYLLGLTLFIKMLLTMIVLICLHLFILIISKKYQPKQVIALGPFISFATMFVCLLSY